MIDTGAVILLPPLCRAGATLVENSPVKDAKFNKNAGLWTVFIEDSDVTYEVNRQASM